MEQTLLEPKNNLTEDVRLAYAVELGEFISLARKDFKTFLMYMFMEPLCDMHSEWCDILDRYRHSVILAPRRHLKSTVIATIYPLWLLGNNDGDG